MAEPSPLLAPLKPALVAPRLWRNGRFVADDWRMVSGDEAVPVSGRAIISLSRWRQEQPNLAALGVPIGIRVEPAEAIDPETDDLARLGVIALVFPKFTDGRAYSTARRLREWGYRGEIRATGDVLIDQLPLMLRAGFDAFEISHAATIRALETGTLPAIPHIYQSPPESATLDWKSRRALKRG